MAALLERFRDHVARLGLFPRPGAALVAVSGGPDSVALLDLMSAVAGELGLRLVVAHADHGIQTDSRLVGQAVRKLAEQYGLPFELGELGLSPGATETAARHARYAWLRSARRRHAARYVVLAHHRDDQLETILMRVLRGSAPAGLAAMAPVNPGGLVRPLLLFSKADLARHAATRGLASHDDPANVDPRHLRSWVRTTLLPLLVDRLGERVRGDVLGMGRAAALERRAWDRLLERLPDFELRIVRRGFEVAREGLARYDDAVSLALVRAAARRAGLVLGIRAARQLVELARRPSGRRLPLGRGWGAEVAFERLRVTREIGCAAEQVVATGQRGSAVFGDFQVAWSPGAAPARLERSDWTTWIAGGERGAGGAGGAGWEVRRPRRGDRLIPLGGVGQRPLRRLLMEARVPRSDRATYPVVARGETILWVPGICRSADDLPQPGTSAVRLDVTKRSELEADRRA
ncbi:MAG: tRNA lysidine(34) synthetase TilS [Gemmatimonadetes bacterium 13_2_20CM_70_9]|nr:MAG: tRNA lysidine(34) synthetase TilS [Gemmatimonadetes bacterium 13_2_20CM_70_9]